MNVVVGFLLAACLGMCAIWVRSYEKSDTLWQVELVEKGLPRRLRTWSIGSAMGRVQFAVRRDAWYVDENLDWPKTGFRHLWDNSPEDPAEMMVAKGWRRDVWGFGAIHDWDVAPPPSKLIPGMPGVQLFPL